MFDYCIQVRGWPMGQSSLIVVKIPIFFFFFGSQDLLKKCIFKTSFNAHKCIISATGERRIRRNPDQCPRHAQTTKFYLVLFLVFTERLIDIIIGQNRCTGATHCLTGLCRSGIGYQHRDRDRFVCCVSNQLQRQNVCAYVCAS